MKMSSKPMTAMSCGTATPASRSAAIAPIAIRSLAAKKALGRFRRASTLAAAIRPPTSLNSAPVTMSAFKPALGQRLQVAFRARRLRTVRPGEHGDLAMAALDEEAGRRGRGGAVVDEQIVDRQKALLLEGRLDPNDADAGVEQRTKFIGVAG